jgi:hypothetical protein
METNLLEFIRKQACFNASWKNSFMVKYQSKKNWKWLRNMIPMAQMVRQSEFG